MTLINSQTLRRAAPRGRHRYRMNDGAEKEIKVLTLWTNQPALTFVHISSDTSILLSRRVGSSDHSSLTSLPAGVMISSFLSLPSPSSVLFHFLWLPSSAHCLHVWVDSVNAGKKS